MRTWRSIFPTIIALLAVGVTQVNAATPKQQATLTPLASTGAVRPAANSLGGIQSLSGSFVVFDPSPGGAECFDTAAPQTLCFRAESFTTDWEHVYSLWLRFPTDWTVNDVYLQYQVNKSTGSIR